jgi:hypothetical protein
LGVFKTFKPWGCPLSGPIRPRMPAKRSGLGGNLSGNGANLSGTTLHGGRANLNNSGGAMFRTQGSRPPPLQRDETSEREEPRCAPALELVAHSCAQCNTRNPALAGRNRRGRLAPSTLWRQRQPAPPPKRAERGVRNVASVVTPTTRTTTTLPPPATTKTSSTNSALKPLSTRAHTLHTLVVTSSRPRLRSFSPRSLNSAPEPQKEVSQCASLIGTNTVTRCND